MSDALTPRALLRLIAVNAYNAYRNALVGNPAPRVEEFYQRITHPVPGDLVLEISTIHMWTDGSLLTSIRKPLPWAMGGQVPCLGVLLRDVMEPCLTQEALDALHRDGDWFNFRGETLADIPTERVFYIQPLDGSVPEFRWTNAEFIVVSRDLEGFL